MHPDLAATSANKAAVANQHLPCRALLSLLRTELWLNLVITAPNDQLRPALEFYFNLGMNDKDVATSVMDHFDSACYGLRCVLALYYMS